MCVWMYIADFGVAAQLSHQRGKRNTFVGTPVSAYGSGVQACVYIHACLLPTPQTTTLGHTHTYSHHDHVYSFGWHQRSFSNQAMMQR
jgi:hypothetical protein